MRLVIAVLAIVACLCANADVRIPGPGGLAPSTTVVALNNANTPTHGATPYTISKSVTAGGSNIVLFAPVVLTPAASTNAAISSITYGGQAMTSCGSPVSSASHYTGQIFYLVNPPTGANNLVVTGDANTSTVYANAVSFTGVDQSTPCRAATVNSATGSSGAGSVSLTITSAAGDLTMSVVNDATSSISSTNQTSEGIDTGGCCGIGSDHATTSAASVTHTWSITGSQIYLLYGFSIQHAP